MGPDYKRTQHVCGEVSTKDYYYVWPRIMPISLLIVFTAPSTVPGPWQVLVGYFISSESNYDIRSRRIFLKLSWKYLLLLSQLIPPLTIVLVKTGRLPFSSAAAFFSVSRITQEEPLWSHQSIPSWIFYLLKPKQNSTHFFKRYSWSIPWTRLVCGPS